MHILVAGTCAFFIVSVFITVFMIDDFCEDPEEYYGSPMYLYENTDMNIFGVVLLFILSFAAIPLYYVVMLLHWICHIGRR